MSGVMMAVQAHLLQSTLKFISAYDVTSQVAHSLLWSILCVGQTLWIFSFFCLGDSNLQSVEFYLGLTCVSEWIWVMVKQLIYTRWML